MKNVTVYILCAFLGVMALPTLHAQVQMGSDILPSGPAGASAHFGWSVDINNAGDRIVVGSYGDNDSSYVQAYIWDNTDWVPMGPIISTGPGPVSVSMDASGNRVVIKYAEPSNKVEVYDAASVYVGTQMYWVWQQEGTTINIPSSSRDDLGDGISMDASGTIFAVGSHSNYNGGMVHLYQWDSSISDWAPMGNPIVSTKELFGYNLHLNDSANILIVGCNLVEKASTYEWDGTNWVEILNGDVRNTYFSYGGVPYACSIFLPPWMICEPPLKSFGVTANADGSRIVTGGPYIFDTYDRWDSLWAESSDGAYARIDTKKSTKNISLSADGNRLVAGVYHDGTVDQWAGKVTLYDWHQNGWVEVSGGRYGVDFDDNLGWSTKMNPSGTRFVTSAVNSDNDGNAYVRVYDIDFPSTTWDGTAWSNGIPDPSTEVVYSGTVFPGSFTCKNLRVTQGFPMVLDSGQTVTIQGNAVFNDGGIFTVHPTASVIFDHNENTITLVGDSALRGEGVIAIEGSTVLATKDTIFLTASATNRYGQLTGTGTLEGTVKAEAYLEPGTGGHYYYLGSPFTNATLNDFNEAGATMVAANSSQGTAWEWDAANAQWVPAGNEDLNQSAIRGKGYALYAGMNGAYGPFLRQDDGTIDLTGTTNNAATVSVPLYYNDGQSSPSDFVTGTAQEDTEGWNLVANPYAATYDWAGQAIPADMGFAIYLFDGTNYTSYVNGAGTASRYIAPFQGFFVQLAENTPGNLVFDRSNRNTSKKSSLGKTTHYTLDGVTLHIADKNNMAHDEVFVGFEAQSTVSFDTHWDARKLRNKGSTPNFYVGLGQDAYSICRVPFSGPRSFPIKLDYKQDGDVMTIHADRSQLQSFGQLTLEDRKTKTMHNLVLGAYTFTHDNSFGADRFILHFGQPSIGIEEPAQEAMVYCFADEKGLNVELGVLHNATVEIYNLAGQLLQKSENLNGKASFDVEKNGLYILKVTAGDFSESFKVIR